MRWLWSAQPLTIPASDFVPSVSHCEEQNHFFGTATLRNSGLLCLKTSTLLEMKGIKIHSLRPAGSLTHCLLSFKELWLVG